MEEDGEAPAVAEARDAPTKLLNRNFTLIWLGQSLSRLGAQGFSIGLLFWIKHATESATLIGLIMMVSNLPAVILGPIGGAFADRHSRRKVIIVSEFVNGICVLALAVLLFLAPTATNEVLIGLFVTSFLSSIISAFFNPAFTAAIPDLVPESRIAAANSLSQGTLQIAVFIGQGLGGLLFRLLGAPLLFLINSFTYLFSAGCATLVTIPQPVLQGESGDWRSQLRAFGVDILDGLNYIWQKSGLRELVLASLFLSFFTVPIIVLLPFFVEDSLKVSVDWYGFLIAGYGAGSLCGFILAGVLKLQGTSRSRVMVVLIILESVGYGALGLVSSPVVALALAFLGGATGGFFTILLTTIVQATTPTEIRGRVFGLLATLSGAIAPIAMGLTGPLADLTGHNIRLIYLACGAIMLVLSVFVCSSRALRRYLAYEPSPEKSQAVDSQVVALH